MSARGERAALAGVEIHEIVAERAAPERERGVARFAQQGEGDAEAAVGRLGAGDRLEHEIDRRALIHQR